MTPRFLRCFELTLRWEGGDTDDTGGRTRYGISQRAYPHEDIANLTLARARQLYFRDYWSPLGLDELRHWRTAAKVFDLAVNTGRVTATRLAQQALGVAGRRVAIDGVMGPITRAGFDSTPQVEMIAALCCEQRGHYERLILRDPARFGLYERGWFRRAAWVPRATGEA